jgi:predicted RNase H-like HicB family nuclease
VCREWAIRGRFTLEFWRDGQFYVGRLLEVPGVFSQGKTLEELQENIQDAYDLMVTQERTPAPAAAQQQPVELDV